MPLQKDLEDLVYYSVDKASPYSMKLHQETNDLSKIMQFSFTQLAMTPQDVAMLWLWFNAHASLNGGKPLSPAVTKDISSVSEMVAAVEKSLEAP